MKNRVQISHSYRYKLYTTNNEYLIDFVFHLKRTFSALVFGPGDVEKVVQVKILPDQQWESFQTFFLKLATQDPNERLVSKVRRTLYGLKVFEVATISKFTESL